MTEQETSKSNNSEFLAKKQAELDALLVWGGEFKEKVEGFEDVEIPDILVTRQEIGRGLVLERGVLTEKDGAAIENWLFTTQVQSPENVSALLTSEQLEHVDNLALKIDVERDCVLDAVIRTRILSDNFKDRSIFLEFGEGPEGLRIGNVFMPVLLPDGREGLARIDTLAYYSSFETQNGVPLRSLVDNYTLEKVDFLHLFPYVLLFTSFVSRKKSEEQIRRAGIVRTEEKIP